MSNEEERTNYGIEECLAVRKGEKTAPAAIAGDDVYDEEDGAISE